jgi:GNAT superfamily N-acetyltransferase
VDHAATVIRDRAADDLPVLVAALVRVAAGDGYPSRWPADPAAWLRTHDPLAAWVADRGGDVLGQVVLRPAGEQMPVTLWCRISGEDPASCALVSRLFVVADARGRGIGRSLVGTACARAAELGLRPLIDVADVNQAAVHLYHRLGWTHIGSYEETFGGDGPPERLHCFAAPR